MSKPIPQMAVRPYLDAIEYVLGRARACNVESLSDAASLAADVVARDGIVFVFGSGHSQLAALEMSRRPGSLLPLQVIYDPMWGRSEGVEGYGRMLLSEVSFTAADCLVVISNSGTTVAPIDVAMAAREALTPVVAVTAVAASSASRSRHSSGRRLFELGDIVLDIGSNGSDAAVRVGSEDIGPASTLAAAALIHEVLVEAVLALAARGIEPPIYRDNSTKSGSEHNARLLGRYLGRLTRVP